MNLHKKDKLLACVLSIKTFSRKANLLSCVCLTFFSLSCDIPHAKRDLRGHNFEDILLFSRIRGFTIKDGFTGLTFQNIQTQSVTRLIPDIFSQES